MQETIHQNDVGTNPTFISLLYPNEESRLFHQNRTNLPNITETVCEELGLNEIFRLRGCPLSDYFTSDEAVIRYRQKTLEDVANLPELKDTLLRITPVLDDINQLRILDRDTSDKDSYLYSITQIELYVSCIETLAAGLRPIKDKITSPAFLSLCKFVFDLTESDYYKDLNAKLNALSSHVHEIKSVTIGVNLDGELRPVNAGVLSVNSDSIKSGKALDKILRLSFKNDAMTAIAPLSPVMTKGQSENREEALVGAFNSALEDVFHSSVKGWRAIVGEYVLDNSDFLLKLYPEIEFISRASDLIQKLKNHPGCSICLPEIRPAGEKRFSAHGLYNPRVALAIEDEIVTNDLVFDDKAGIYILTGPNRGGKSVITVACGAAQAFFQLGLPVPAADAVLSPVDAIFTHFPEGADDTIDKGRLGEECNRLREIFSDATPNSLILLDESLSSTGAYEATYIASEILVAFAALGVRGIFSTHLHELAAALDDLNARSAEVGGVALDTLVAGMEKGKRSFRIVRAKPDGKSYAKDITDKYGLSFDSLMSHVEEAKKKEASR
ncbi:MAG: hypothetical protein MJ082_04400 [Clostridia bacterium]|nr:hypothetical protein [Clostridia bacterium]